MEERNTTVHSLLSVVVPVYNVEDKLIKCVESIMHQSYHNLQIILIDDGSTDCSGIICDYFCSIDNRIEVYHQNNIGLMKTRTKGSRLAIGDYIIWVDSDDWVEPTYFEKMMKEEIDSDADLVVANIFFDIGNDSRIITNNIPVGIYRASEIICKMIYSGVFYDYGILPHGVTKLFKREALMAVQEKLEDGICIGEDAAVVYPYVYNCSTVMITDICGYHYVQNASSITKTKLKDEIYGIECLIDYLKKIFENNADVLLQIEIYCKYLILLRDISYWDERGILYPYGGIEKNKKIVIYGAGGIGRNLWNYCLDHKLSVVAWIDRNYVYYKKNGLPVIEFDEFMSKSLDWDYILIANVNKSVADSIRSFLINKNIKDSKILWLSSDFLEI